MGHLVLVRHGRPTAGSDAHPDPGLDDFGRRQASAMADALAPSGPRPLLSSPLRRSRETAAALAERWGIEAVVEPGFADVEVPGWGPERDEWLRAFMAGTWEGQPSELVAWRERVVATLLGLEGRDCVVVTHFFPLNVAVGEAIGDRRVVCFAPDHCSRTEVDIVGGKVLLVRQGHEDRSVLQ